MTPRFLADVQYDVWLRGGNPDAVSEHRVDAVEVGGGSTDEAADMELRLQRAKAAVERDMREWEANEWDLPANERFCR